MRNLNLKNPTIRTCQKSWLLKGAEACALIAVSLLTGVNLHAQPVDPAFVREWVVGGFGKTKVRFGPDGRMYVSEKMGRLVQYDPDGSGGFVSEPRVLLDLVSEVDGSGESGLLGLELDPDFENTRFVYLFFTTATDQRLVRYTLNPSLTSVDLSSRTTLLNGLPREYPYHKAGDIGIHPLDPHSVFIMLGDDFRPDLVGDLNHYEGKLLRVDSATGEGLPDNPFFDGNLDSVRSRIWARGFRNPFRFAFLPGRIDAIIVSENGDGTDRIARIGRGGNGAWNTQGDSGGFLNPPDPNVRILQIVEPSTIGIAVVPSGPFAPEGSPTVYVGNWYPGPYWGIQRFRLSGDDLDGATPIPDGSGGNNWEAGTIAVDMTFGPDGHLYIADTGGDEADGTWYAIQRYKYVGGTPPVAAIGTNPDPARGEVGLIIQFSDTSTTGTNPIVSRMWDFGDGASSSVANPTHTFSEAGAYPVTLTVTDSVGLTSRATSVVEVYDSTTVDLMLSVFDGSSLPATPFGPSSKVSFFQADGTTPVRISGGLGDGENELNIPANGHLSRELVLPLTGNGLILEVASQDAGSPFHAARLGFRVALGGSDEIDAQAFLGQTVIRGRVESVRGAAASIDLGLHSNGQPVPVAGGRDYLESSPEPASGVAHRIDSDVLGFFYLPVPQIVAGSTLDVEICSDRNSGRFSSVSTNEMVSAGAVLDRTYKLGEWYTGTGGDSLPLPAMDPIQFSKVQEIFSEHCAGCHRANTTNSGGLDLTDGNSLAELVDQPSALVPGLKLVDPGNPLKSYLFEKVNHPTPQQGSRMRPTNPLSVEDQALIRDWITQLEPTYESFVRLNFGVAPQDPSGGLLDDADGNGTSNGRAYIGEVVPSVQSAGSALEIAFDLDPTISGLGIVVEGSTTMDETDWVPLAYRRPGANLWRSISGLSISENVPGRVMISHPGAASGAPRRFYRMGFVLDEF